MNYREAGQNEFIATTSDLRPSRDGCQGMEYSLSHDTIREHLHELGQAVVTSP